MACVKIKWGCFPSWEFTRVVINNNKDRRVIFDYRCTTWYLSSLWSVNSNLLKINLFGQFRENEKHTPLCIAAQPFFWEPMQCDLLCHTNRFLLLACNRNEPSFCRIDLLAENHLSLHLTSLHPTRVLYLGFHKNFALFSALLVFFFIQMPLRCSDDANPNRLLISRLFRTSRWAINEFEFVTMERHLYKMSEMVERWSHNKQLMPPAAQRCRMPLVENRVQINNRWLGSSNRKKRLVFGWWMNSHSHHSNSEVKKRKFK